MDATRSGLGFAALALLLACAAQTRTDAAFAPASTVEREVAAEPVEPEPEPVVAKPVPLVELDAVAVAAIPDPPPEPPPPEPAPFDAEQLERILAVQTIVEAAASEHGVEPALVNGLIWVESKFEPRARGPAGAQGLMQLMPRTAGAMAKLLARKRASYDPDFNIHAGTLLLSRLLARFDGDVSLALAAYNRGSGVVAGWVAAGEPLPERTQGFVDRVLEAREWFERPLPGR